MMFLSFGMISSSEDEFNNKETKLFFLYFLSIENV